MTATLRQPNVPHSGAAPQPRRRLLLISYHFPPGQAAGALRWEKLAGFAVERGWGVDVVTLDPASLAAPDWTRQEALPAGIAVYGVGSREHPAERLDRVLAGLYRRLGRPGSPQGPSARGARSPSDAGARAGLVARHEVGWRATSPWDYVRAFEAWLEFAHDGAWSRAAARIAMRLAQPGVHRAIVTSGPPHMVHQAGRLVSARTGLPLVIDMRDPWSLAPSVDGSRASPAWFWLAERYERSAVEQAALVVTNTEPFRSAMQELYPGARGRIVTVLNGCDEDELPRPPAAPTGAAGPAARRFTIAYAGSIYIDRNPRAVFRAAARVVRDLGLTPAQFGFDFIGFAASFGGVPLDVIAREEGVAGYVTTRPVVPRREALALLAQAAMLLSLPQDIRLCIPSKLFDYMQFDAWLLVLAKRDSASELLLRGTAADVVEPDDVERITHVLRTRYLEFAAGARPPRVAANGRFGRRAQAQVLFDALDASVGSGVQSLARVG